MVVVVVVEEEGERRCRQSEEQSVRERARVCVFVLEKKGASKEGWGIVVTLCDHQELGLYWQRGQQTEAVHREPNKSVE